MKDPYFENFVDLVERMRQAQNDYISRRHYDSLVLIKLEREVDQFIIKHGTQDLFKEEKENA
jgi:hypothetical protein